MRRVLFVILLLILAGCSAASTNDDFAKCLNQKGVKMYGAFWCPHCQAQKKLFGSSFQYVNYIECSLPDGKTQTEYCDKQNITAYPVWEFSDKSRVDGETTFAILSERSGCPLP